MKNLLRSDFYRLFRSKSFYICTAISMLLMALNILLVEWASNLAGEEGVVISENPIFKDGITYGLTAFANGNLEIILGIIIAIFVSAEFSHGTMKNVVSKGFSKINIYLSKLITMVSTTLIMIIATFLTGFICATILSGSMGDFSGDNLAIIFKTIGIEILLNTALVAILVLVPMVIRNIGGAIAINIFGVMTVAPLLFNILQLIARDKIKFTDYSLLNNIAFYFSNTAKGSDYLRSVIVGLVFLVGATALGIFAFKKSDVK